jgi:hypothetical protein
VVVLEGRYFLTIKLPLGIECDEHLKNMEVQLRERGINRSGAEEDLVVYRGYSKLRKHTAPRVVLCS